MFLLRCYRSFNVQVYLFISIRTIVTCVRNEKLFDSYKNSSQIVYLYQKKRSRTSFDIWDSELDIPINTLHAILHAMQDTSSNTSKLLNSITLVSNTMKEQVH